MAILSVRFFWRVRTLGGFPDFPVHSQRVSIFRVPTLQLGLLIAIKI